MRLKYFAWVRERIGCVEEDRVLPPQVRTAADVVTWLKTLGEGYEHALEHPAIIRVAFDQMHVAPETPIGDTREIALFPPMTGG